MNSKVITDNVSEKIEIGWDDGRYIYEHYRKLTGQISVSIWNPKEGHAIKECIEETENLEELFNLIPGGVK